MKIAFEPLPLSVCPPCVSLCSGSLFGPLSSDRSSRLGLPVSEAPGLLFFIKALTKFHDISAGEVSFPPLFASKSP